MHKLAARTKLCIYHQQNAVVDWGTFSVTDCDELCRGRIDVRMRFRIDEADMA